MENISLKKQLSSWDGVEWKVRTYSWVTYIIIITPPQTWREQTVYIHIFTDIHSYVPTVHIIFLSSQHSYWCNQVRSQNIGFWVLIWHYRVFHPLPGMRVTILSCEFLVFIDESSWCGAGQGVGAREAMGAVYLEESWKARIHQSSSHSPRT